MSSMSSSEDFDGGRRLPLVEDFYTIQGEGFHSGKPAYFIRLGGCDVGCKWCDAKFTWNAKQFPPVDVDEIVARAVSYPAQAIVVTGGEPSLYPLEYITSRLIEHGLKTFVETSGVHNLSGHFDWICLSPKPQQEPTEQMFARAHELKVIIEKVEDLRWAEQCAAKVSRECLLYLQPEWSKYDILIDDIVEYAKANPRWNVSIQTHKFMRIP